MTRNGTLAGAIAELTRRFSGDLLQQGDVLYDEARRVHNGMIDKHPAVIARCLGAADIAAAVRFAREHDLEIAVKGGGHNVAGRATIDDGMMIDLTRMKGIHVDPAARTIRAQCGVTWNEFYRETEAHGLSTNGGAVSSTGIAGLSLGGGMGLLMGKYGLTVDSMLEVELVLADSTITRASSEENPDLFWAVRGGGGNFGVAASILYRLHPIGPEVTGGLITYSFDDAREVLRFFRDFTSELPDELGVMSGMMHAPDGSKLAAILACHCGDPAAADRDLSALRGFGKPLMDQIGPMTFLSMNCILDDGFPAGALNYWKSNFIEDLSLEAIDTLVEGFGRSPASMSSLLLEHVHGAACRVGAEETAFPHRNEGHNLLIVSQWQNPEDTQACTDWARDTFSSMAPFSTDSRYVNYLDADDAGDPVRAAYGPNYARLQEIKARFDPENIFHMNQNIPPAVD